jgi:hypothetical protein
VAAPVAPIVALAVASAVPGGFGEIDVWKDPANAQVIVTFLGFVRMSAWLCRISTPRNQPS